MAPDAGRDVIAVFGIALLVLLTCVTAAFVWRGRRHAAAFSCCLSRHAKAMMMSAAKRISLPSSLPTSRSLQPLKRPSANNHVTLDVVRDPCAKMPLSSSASSAPIGSGRTASFRSAPHGLAAASAAGATSRRERLNEARSDIGRRESRSARTSSLDRTRRGYRVRPLNDDDRNATGHVTSDSCVNLAVSHVTASGDENGLHGIAVFVAGECVPHRVRLSQC